MTKIATVNVYKYDTSFDGVPGYIWLDRNFKQSETVFQARFATSTSYVKDWCSAGQMKSNTH